MYLLVAKINFLFIWSCPLISPHCCVQSHLPAQVKWRESLRSVCLLTADVRSMSRCCFN